jgi:hypothetical protein
MPEPPTTHTNTNIQAVPEAPLPKPLTRAERIRALRGKYAWVPFSSDDHVRRKREEMEREKH